MYHVNDWYLKEPKEVRFVIFYELVCAKFLVKMKFFQIQFAAVSNISSDQLLSLGVYNLLVEMNSFNVHSQDRATVLWQIKPVPNKVSRLVSMPFGWVSFSKEAALGLEALVMRLQCLFRYFSGNTILNLSWKSALTKRFVTIFSIDICVLWYSCVMSFVTIDICVLCPSVRWLQRILDVCRRMQNRMGLFSTATKLFVWRLRLKVQAAQPLQSWNWGVNT